MAQSPKPLFRKKACSFPISYINVYIYIYIFFYCLFKEQSDKNITSGKENLIQTFLRTDSTTFSSENKTKQKNKPASFLVSQLHKKEQKERNGENLQERGFSHALRRRLGAWEPAPPPLLYSTSVASLREGICPRPALWMKTATRPGGLAVCARLAVHKARAGTQAASAQDPRS